MGNDRIVYIRTDGNSHIASGHLVRCISVALACCSLGIDVCFLVSDGESFCLLKELLDAQADSGNHPAIFPDANGNAGRNTASLPGNITALRLKTAQYDNLEKELPEVISLLTASLYHSVFEYGAHDIYVTNIVDNANYINAANVTDILFAEKYEHIIYFIDSYFVTRQYLSALSPFVKTAYIDDLRAFDYSVNLIINYDVILPGDMATYQNAYRNAEHMLLGASYTPLRSQFLHKQIGIKEQLTDVLITTGGSDPFHFCLNFLAYLRSRLTSEINPLHDIQTRGNIPAVIFHIVIGKLNADREKLWQAARNLPCLELHENVSDMASLMGKCDIAVSAAGTTLYELCALGVPSISFTMADNQLTAAKAFDAAGAIPCAGDIRSDREAVLEAVFHFIGKCSFQERKTAHETMHSLIDGKGSLRIAHALERV
ncbi:MAG: UDP-2,4-diacetamido-2,4,6-trideoxy-beta-L-altropyranose hydrolase [Lachnospiraceae bacterium]|nr:UDP-2,4-diacetamido-2,4,6-trideoxy-beta-L-altropyranose hydrolase [Lachnospiraceae bacterium]